MFGKTVLVVAVLALELSPCCCQFGGEMMGGLGAMMGGGMGGLGGMMGGMGGMGSGMGGMGSGIGSMIRQRAMASAMNTINDAVHFIVGPQANPDQTLIDFAMAQRGPPRSMTAMFRYLPHLQRVARTTYGPWLADMAVKNPAPASFNTSITSGTNTTSTGTSGGKTLVQLEAELDAIIMQRAVEYMDRPQTQQQIATGPSMGAGMGGLGMMIPSMIQGMMGAYM